MEQIDSGEMSFVDHSHRIRTVEENVPVYCCTSPFDGYMHMRDHRPRSMSEFYLPKVFQYENVGRRVEPLSELVNFWSKSYVYEDMNPPALQLHKPENEK